MGKEFDEIVNDDLRSQASLDEQDWLRSQDNVNDWVWSLRSILGSLKGTKAAKRYAVLCDKSADKVALKDYYLWCSKTEVFWAAVENRLEEALLIRAMYDGSELDDANG